MYTIKTKKPFFILLILAVTLLACNFNRQRTRTISVNNGSTSLKIEYCGTVIFNEAGTAVDAISPTGYVNYIKNGNRLFIKSRNNGTLHYKIYNNSTYRQPTHPQAQAFIQHAVKEMYNHYAQ